MSNKSTAAQRSYIDSLARRVGDEQFTAAFDRAARINGNTVRAAWETPIQSAGRLTRAAASALIDDLRSI